jgi:predicted transcriptional regulator
MENFPVVFMDLPTTIRGFVREKDGVCTVVINARQSSEIQRRTYAHEVEHILHGDLDAMADSVDRDAFYLFVAAPVYRHL